MCFIAPPVAPWKSGRSVFECKRLLWVASCSSLRARFGYTDTAAIAIVERVFRSHGAHVPRITHAARRWHRRAIVLPIPAICVLARAMP